MNRKLVFDLIILLSCILTLVNVPGSASFVEQWVPCIPSSDQVDLKFWMKK
ncbi:MAG: hypothetical protein OEY88_03810 [Candidatus Bathyarchaeota archaeon]|nr:hypothetical protein [Candidatus Bathyarchaeota archaeon]